MIDNEQKDLFTYDDENLAYYARHKLSNGQYCMIAFVEYYYGYSRTLEYFVIFAVANKKKNLNGYFNGDKNNNLTLKMTGTCGTEALYWARNMIHEFEKTVKEKTENSKYDEVKICVMGEDGRRFRCYAKYLQKHGYRITSTQWGLSLIKSFRKDGWHE